MRGRIHIAHECWYEIEIEEDDLQDDDNLEELDRRISRLQDELRLYIDVELDRRADTGEK